MSSTDKLPQLCASCRKLKCAHLGRFKPHRHKYGVKVWTCFECLENRPVKREGRRQHDSSPDELLVARELRRLKVDAVQEYQLGPFFYDFAVPKLRLLIEVDSRTWHRHPSRVARDRRKTKHAESKGWKLSRLSGPHLDLAVRLEIERRLQEFE